MAGSPLTVSSTRQTPSPGSGGLANGVSFSGMFGWNPWVALYFLAGAAPDGAAREKPGLPPTLGGL